MVSLNEKETTDAIATSNNLRRAQLIIVVTNILMCLTIIAMIILLWTQKGQRLRWGIWGLLVLWSIGKISVMLKYLGVFPPQYSSIPMNSSLALINLKGCIIYPIMAIILGMYTSPKAFYISATTYFIASAIWALVFYPLNYRFYEEPFLTEKGRRVMHFKMEMNKWVYCIFWLVCAAVLWHKYKY